MIVSLFIENVEYYIAKHDHFGKLLEEVNAWIELYGSMYMDLPKEFPLEKQELEELGFKFHFITYQMIKTEVTINPEGTISTTTRKTLPYEAQTPLELWQAIEYYGEETLRGGEKPIWLTDVLKKIPATRKESK